MSFLTLNGLEVQVLDGSAKRNVGDVGPRGRSHNGVIRDGRRSEFVSLDLSTPVLAEDDAHVVEHLIRGSGWHFSFDESLYSEGNGLGPDAGYTAALVTASPAAKYGTSSLNVNSSGGSVSWTASLLYASTWSMSWWYNFNNADPAIDDWTHYVVVRDGGYYTVYTDGAVTYGPSLTLPTAPTNFTVTESGLDVTFSLLGKKADGTNSAVVYYDDLVFVPWVMNQAMVTAIVDSLIAFSDLPFLWLAGDVIRDAGPLEVRGTVQDVTYVQAIVSTWADNNASVQFRLEQKTAR